MANGSSLGRSGAVRAICASADRRSACRSAAMESSAWLHGILALSCRQPDCVHSAHLHVAESVTAGGVSADACSLTSRKRYCCSDPCRRNLLSKSSTKQKWKLEMVHGARRRWQVFCRETGAGRRELLTGACSDRNECDGVLCTAHIAAVCEHTRCGTQFTLCSTKPPWSFAIDGFSPVLHRQSSVSRPTFMRTFAI